MRGRLASRLRQLFCTVPRARAPITGYDRRNAATERAHGRQGNVRRVEDTYDLRWTRRYRFDFAESMISAPVKHGGVIVFGSGVVAELEVTQHPRCLGILNLATRWLGMRGQDTGIAVGCTFRGRYRSPAGDVYGEQSLTMQISVITKHDLIKLATVLIRESGLESALVKHGASGKIYLVTSR